MGPIGFRKLPPSSVLTHGSVPRRRLRRAIRAWPSRTSRKRTVVWRPKVVRRSQALNVLASVRGTRAVSGTSSPSVGATAPSVRLWSSEPACHVTSLNCLPLLFRLLRLLVIGPDAHVTIGHLIPALVVVFILASRCRGTATARVRPGGSACWSGSGIGGTCCGISGDRTPSTRAPILRE